MVHRSWWCLLTHLAACPDLSCLSHSEACALLRGTCHPPQAGVGDLFASVRQWSPSGTVIRTVVEMLHDHVAAPNSGDTTSSGMWVSPLSVVLPTDNSVFAGAVSSVVAVQDGFAIGTLDGELAVVRVQTLNSPGSVRRLASSSGAISSLAFSAGRLLAGTMAATVMRHKLDDGGAPVTTFEASDAVVCVGTLGELVVAGTWEGGVDLWGADGSSHVAVEVSLAPVTSLAFLDGMIAVVTHTDSVALLFSDGRVAAASRLGFSDTPTSILSVGKWLYVGLPQGVEIFELQRRVGFLRTSTTVLSLAEKDGRVASGTMFGIDLFSANQTRGCAEFRLHTGTAVGSVAWVSSRIVVGGGLRLEAAVDPGQAADRVFTFFLDAVIHTGAQIPTVVGAASSSQYLAVWTEGNQLLISESWLPLWVTHEQDWESDIVAALFLGVALVVGTLSGDLWVFTCSSGALHAASQTKAGDAIAAVTSTSVGIAVGTWANVVDLFSAPSLMLGQLPYGELQVAGGGMRGYVLALATSTDDSVVVATGGGMVSVFGDDAVKRGGGAPRAVFEVPGMGSAAAASGLAVAAVSSTPGDDGSDSVLLWTAGRLWMVGELAQVSVILFFGELLVAGHGTQLTFFSLSGTPSQTLSFSSSVVAAWGSLGDSLLGVVTADGQVKLFRRSLLDAPWHMNVSVSDLSEIV